MNRLFRQTLAAAAAVSVFALAAPVQADSVTLLSVQSGHSVLLRAEGLNARSRRRRTHRGRRSRRHLSSGSQRKVARPYDRSGLGRWPASNVRGYRYSTTTGRSGADAAQFDFGTERSGRELRQLDRRSRNGLRWSAIPKSDRHHFAIRPNVQRSKSVIVNVVTIAERSR